MIRFMTRNRRSELERLVDRTVLGPTHPELGTCWLFTGTTTPYGRIAKAQDSYTHRLGWKLLRGAIPEGMELHHRCGVYACWNPDHLQIVTHAENLAYRRKARLRATARPRQASDLKPVRSPGQSGRPPSRPRADQHVGRADEVDGIALPARFWKKVDKNGPVPPLRPELGPCWLHEGTPEKATGYIRCEINRLRDYVHRFVYRAFVEPIPDGKEIDHQCHNADPSCPSDASCLHRRITLLTARRARNPGHRAPPSEWLIRFVMLTTRTPACRVGLRAVLSRAIWSAAHLSWPIRSRLTHIWSATALQPSWLAH